MQNCSCCGLGEMGRRGFIAAGLASLALSSARAQQVPASAGPPAQTLIDELVAANRILYNENVVDGFGHIAARHDKSPERYLLARSMAPGLVTAADIIEYDLDSNACEPANPARASYLERFIHGAIFRARPDVMAVVHSHSATVIPFANVAAPLRAMNHISSFLGTGAPVFEIRDSGGPATDMLIKNAALGSALAQALGRSSVLLMRGHGAVAVGPSIRHAVYRAVYTEVNARMQAEAMKLGTPNYLNEQEAAAAMTTTDRLVDRPWELWLRKVQPAR